MVGITHAAVVAVADDGTSPVGSDEWNADHVVTHLYPLDSYAINGTYGDDFTGASLDTGKWTRRNYTSGAETYQVGKAGTYLRIAQTGRGVGDGYFQSVAAPDGTYAMKFIPRWYNQVDPAWGIAILDSSGNGIETTFYSNSRALYCIDISTYTSYNSGSQVGPGQLWGQNGSAFPGSEQAVWIYLRKSGNNYYAAYSFDGEVWTPESSAKSKTFTVAYLGFIIPALGSVVTAAVVDIDWFNKIA